MNSIFSVTLTFSFHVTNLTQGMYPAGMYPPPPQFPYYPQMPQMGSSPPSTPPAGLSKQGGGFSGLSK